MKPMAGCEQCGQSMYVMCATMTTGSLMSDTQQVVDQQIQATLQITQPNPMQLLAATAHGPSCIWHTALGIQPLTVGFQPQYAAHRGL